MLAVSHAPLLRCPHFCDEYIDWHICKHLASAGAQTQELSHLQHFDDWGDFLHQARNARQNILVLIPERLIESVCSFLSIGSQSSFALTSCSCLELACNAVFSLRIRLQDVCRKGRIDETLWKSMIAYAERRGSAIRDLCLEGREWQKSCSLLRLHHIKQLAIACPNLCRFRMNKNILWGEEQDEDEEQEEDGGVAMPNNEGIEENASCLQLPSRLIGPLPTPEAAAALPSPFLARVLQVGKDLDEAYEMAKELNETIKETIYPKMLPESLVETSSLVFRGRRMRTSEAGWAKTPPLAQVFAHGAKVRLQMAHPPCATAQLEYPPTKLKPKKRKHFLQRRIAVIDRGGCTFVEKAVRAVACGAAGVIIVNNDSSNPDSLVGMSDAGMTQQSQMVTIPVMMVSC